MRRGEAVRRASRGPSSADLQRAEAASDPRASDAGAPARRDPATLFIGKLLERHALNHLTERRAWEMRAHALHRRREGIHDVVELPGLAGRAYELKLHAHPFYD
ncbi:MAG: hypothetical protein LH467_12580 [Gemmatimonadaceae bacterium]|nr:hypothetical protein [Gemmatimonadaceae bacterium]